MKNKPYFLVQAKLSDGSMFCSSFSDMSAALLSAMRLRQLGAKPKFRTIKPR